MTWLGELWLQFLTYWYLVVLFILIPVGIVVSAGDWTYRKATGRPGLAERMRAEDLLGVEKIEPLRQEADLLLQDGFRVRSASKLRTGSRVVFGQHTDPQLVWREALQIHVVHVIEPRPPDLLVLTHTGGTTRIALSQKVLLRHS